MEPLLRDMTGLNFCLTDKGHVVPKPLIEVTIQGLGKPESNTLQ